MRNPLVAGNWKLNKTAEQATLLIADLLPGLQAVKKVECVICPPFTALMVASNMMRGSGVGLGAQDVFWEDSGAFTGEVSAPMLKELCDYVIIGHSERRAYFAETNETVNKKLHSSLKHGLIPIVCVGETLHENESGNTAEIVSTQIQAGLKNVEPQAVEKIVLAYEPVWAIGTGKAASAQGAQEVIGSIARATLGKMFGDDLAGKVRILYGGSVNAQNAGDFFSMPDIDGALVGGASLKAADFIGIVQAAAR